ncbi:MAG: EAL domain-containing protein [Rhodanobacter sp.]
MRDLTTDPDTATTTGAIIAMARSRNKVVIAEGVETQDQGDVLHKAGCLQLQVSRMARRCRPQRLSN